MHWQTAHVHDCGTATVCSTIHTHYEPNMIVRATSVSREQSLMPWTKKNEQVTPLVVKFHPDLLHLTRILLDHQYIIDISPRLREALPKSPLVVCHHPPNLKDLLVKAVFKQKRETDKGNSPCKRPCCKTCAHIKIGATFSSTTTGAWFRVKATTDDVLFNTPKKQRIHSAFCVTGHRLDIKHQRIEKPVAKHFSLPDHSMDDL